VLISLACATYPSTYPSDPGSEIRLFSVSLPLHHTQNTCQGIDDEAYEASPLLMLIGSLQVARLLVATSPDHHPKEHFRSRSASRLHTLPTQPIPSLILNCIFHSLVSVVKQLHPDSTPSALSSPAAQHRPLLGPYGSDTQTNERLD